MELLINNPNLYTHLCVHINLKLTNYFGVTQNVGITFRVGSSFKEGLNPTCVLLKWPKMQVLHLG
jgi:hypothetical protein